MNKVTVEITSKGWKTTAILNGKEYVEEHRKIGPGRTKQVSNFTFEDCDEISDELYEALDSFFAFDVMKALEDYERFLQS